MYCKFLASQSKILTPPVIGAQGHRPLAARPGTGVSWTAPSLAGRVSSSPLLHALPAPSWRGCGFIACAIAPWTCRFKLRFGGLAAGSRPQFPQDTPEEGTNPGSKNECHSQQKNLGVSIRRIHLLKAHLLHTAGDFCGISFSLKTKLEVDPREEIQFSGRQVCRLQLLCTEVAGVSQCLCC